VNTFSITQSGPADAPVFVRPFLHRLSRLWRHGALVLETPRSRQPLVIRGQAPGPEAHWAIRSWRCVGDTLRAGSVGFAESYIAGHWETPNLSRLLEAFAANMDGIAEMARGNRLVRGVHALNHALRRNSRTGARRNILAHYDLGNAFYGLWLDPSMTYSSALFSRPGLALEAAQAEKYAALMGAVGVADGSRVLEIGCGWGGFAEAAARVGAHVTGVTLSPSQLEYAQRRLAEAGLGARVDLRLCDYRDLRGQYDAIASIEMFEAVGEAYWPTYFRQVHDLLRPGGRAGLQIIVIRDDLFESYRRKPDFIQMHVFPGGMLPTEARVKAEAATAGLEVAGLRRFGQDYADTLALWRERFDARWEEIRALGFDERFRRLWRYYLAYCEAGFRTGRTDVIQITLARP
jgi:cyclopropane-fatty-acyl-phospholipid synthase